MKQVSYQSLNKLFTIITHLLKRFVSLTPFTFPRIAVQNFVAFLVVARNRDNPIYL